MSKTGFHSMLKDSTRVVNANETAFLRKSGSQQSSRFRRGQNRLLKFFFFFSNRNFNYRKIMRRLLLGNSGSQVQKTIQMIRKSHYDWPPLFKLDRRLKI